MKLGFDEFLVIMTILFILSVISVDIYRLRGGHRHGYTRRRKDPTLSKHVGGHDGLIPIQYDRYNDDYYIIQGGIKTKIPV